MMAGTRLQRLRDKYLKLHQCPSWFEKINPTNQSKGGCRTADLTDLEPKTVCDKYPTVATYRFRTHRSSKQPEELQNKRSTIIKSPIQAPALSC